MAQAQKQSRQDYHQQQQRHHQHQSSSPWLRKPLFVVLQQEHRSDHTVDNSLKRHLSLFDLVVIGVGGTIGSGIFVLTGYIAHNYAGPSTVISFIISGICASTNGLCFAEMSCRIPSAGSTYVYAYVAIGELAAFIAAACLTLEYAISGAAVARSWGDKCSLWIIETFPSSLPSFVQSYILQPGYGINPLAFVVSSAAVALLLKGIQESKQVTNFFTVFKVALVLFMIIGGLFLFDSDNINPFIPTTLGTAGLLRGATSSFFGYIGYDEVCVLAGEALHPRRDMPRAVMLTLFTVTILYALASFALVGMQPYTKISDVSAFPLAFSYNNVKWAATITSVGEVISLPVVVLISIMAQPRLLCALSQDGLLPSHFGRIDENGNLYNGTLISGIIMTIIATFVPFNYLDDLISTGILLAFSMTDSSVILMKCHSPINQPNLLGQYLFIYNILCFITGLILTNWYDRNEPHTSFGNLSSYFFCGITILTVQQMSNKFPRKSTFGFGHPTLQPTSATTNESTQSEHSATYFETPCVPYLPCLGMFVNWFLISQLEIVGIILLALYIGVSTVFYFCYGNKNSVGNQTGWHIPDYPVPYESVRMIEGDENYNDNEYNHDGNDEDSREFKRNISLPRYPASTEQETQ